MKIQLINAPQEYSISKHIESGWYPPLGLLSIGSYLKERGISVEILDGELLSLKEIIEKIDSDIIGIGFSILSSGSMEKIIEEGKEKGVKKVVVGGQAATPLYKQLLSESSNIDAVIRHDGEKAMHKIAAGIPFKDIENLAYRENGKILTNRISYLTGKDFPMINRSLSALELYIDNYTEATQKAKKIFPFLRPTSSSLRRSCPHKMGKNKGCSFCARIDNVRRTISPKKFWEEMFYLKKNFAIDMLVDMSDDFIDKNWLEEFKDICDNSKKLDISFRVYGNPGAIDKKTAKLLKNIGVITVLMGIESGDDEILKINCGLKSVEKNLRAVRYLSEEGILIADSYVLGMIGETQESLDNTVKLFKEIQGYGTEITYCSVCLPLPGSKVWDEMMKIKSLRENYSSTYRLDPEKLSQDYVRNFCSVPLKTLQKTRDKILSSSNFGDSKWLQP